MRRGEASRAVNSINLRIATICGCVAAAIMIGATMATRISFPPTANQLVRPVPATVEPAVLSIGQSAPVNQFARVRTGKPLFPKTVAQTPPTSQPASTTNPTRTVSPSPIVTPSPTNPPDPLPAAAPQPVQTGIPGRW